MIKNRESLSMAEAAEFIDKERSPEAYTFVKKFVKIKPKDALETREKLKKLNLMRLGEESISKIIDLLPENEEDLSKIFISVSLDNEESNKILDIIKEVK